MEGSARVLLVRCMMQCTSKGNAASRLSGAWCTMRLSDKLFGAVEHVSSWSREGWVPWKYGKEGMLSQAESNVSCFDSIRLRNTRKHVGYMADIVNVEVQFDVNVEIEVEIEVEVEVEAVRRERGLSVTSFATHSRPFLAYFSSRICFVDAAEQRN